jgi:glutathione S-transferase
MFPSTEPARHKALKIAALGTGLGDKAVSLFYERRLHREISETWVERCRTQINAVLAVLENDRAGRKTRYWFGDRLGHADVAVVASLRFISEAHPSLLAITNFPALDAHAKLLEALPVFKTISQAFVAPGLIARDLNQPTRKRPASKLSSSR